jgi:hypothetical protein
MWLYLIIGVGLVLVVAWFRLGAFLPANARCLIRIHNGAAFVSGEPLPHHVMSSLADVLHTSGVKKGFIAIMPDGRVKFSPQIPKELHQRLRNVVLNP